METEFVQMIRAHAGLLNKVCRLYGNDDEDRKDLYQEIVLQLWRAFPRFRQEAQRSTWMYRIALNTAISLFRRQAHQPTREAFGDELLNVAQGSVPPEVEERLGQLYRAVERLSPVEKALIVLYLEDNSYEEMAAVLGISPSNVGVKLNRIKTKLKTLVQFTNP